MTNGGITNFEQWSKESFTSKKFKERYFVISPWWYHGTHCPLYCKGAQEVIFWRINVNWSLVVAEYS